MKGIFMMATMKQAVRLKQQSQAFAVEQEQFS